MSVNLAVFASSQEKTKNECFPYVCLLHLLLGAPVSDVFCNSDSMPNRRYLCVVAMSSVNTQA